MKLRLHHINLSTGNVDRMDRFYRDVLGLSRTEAGLPALAKSRGCAGDVAFVDDGHVQMHLDERDVPAEFATGRIVNPVARGHIAFRTDDLAAVEAHLGAQGVPYSDWGARRWPDGTRSAATTPTATSSRCTRPMPEGSAFSQRSEGGNSAVTSCHSATEVTYASP